MQPELRALDQELRALREDEVLASVISGSTVRFSRLSNEDVAVLLTSPAAQLFLMAAADLNRTALRAGTATADAQLVAPPLRRAFVVRSKLPPAADFSTVVELALQRRAATLNRSVNAATETLFRERLEFEGVPIRMRGAYTQGLLITRRKPDGVYPDPATGEAPRLYLEIKKINRVRDDLQKRLYEIAEVSLELKFLYGTLELRGLNLRELLDDSSRALARRELRQQIAGTFPAVVALLLCPTDEIPVAERYRENAEAFIDRVFFANQVDECIAYLADLAPVGS